MALASGIGAELEPLTAAAAFGEAQGRYVVTTRNAAALEEHGLPVRRIGRTGGDALIINGQPLPLADLRTAHQSFFRDWMEG